MSGRPDSEELVENQRCGVNAQAVRDATATTRNAKKDPISHLYAEYVHALLSHPKIERRRRQR
jgi:hypothetical protein